GSTGEPVSPGLAGRVLGGCFATTGYAMLSGFTRGRGVVGLAADAPIAFLVGAAAIITPLSLLTLAGIRPTLAAFLVVASLISLLGWWFGRRSSVRSPAANVRERGAATVFAAAAAAAVIVLCVLTWLAAL